jgi:Zn-dependent protease with chaperone function
MITPEDTRRSVPSSIKHWHSEKSLKIFVVLISIVIWILLTVTIIGILYALFIALGFFILHVGFITYLRGSAVKLGPEQFPELYKRVEILSSKAGLSKVPDVYLMQAGGTLNAMATKFLKSHMIILFTDLLDACGDNNDARDMIIGHEIGHLKAGHLDWYWFILPGMFVPILGQAYSRAREYTCDRYGYELCDNKESGIKGLVILSAGGKFANSVKMSTFINQKRDLDTAWMTLGRWFSSYPPIVDRIATLDRTIPGAELTYSKGALQAVILLLIMFTLPFGAMIFGFSKISSLVKNKTGLSSLKTSNNYFDSNYANDSTDTYDYDMLESDTSVKNPDSVSAEQ